MKKFRQSAILLGFTVDEISFMEMSDKSGVMPTQTHRFAWNLTNAMRSSGTDVSLLSVLPVPNYPEYPRRIVRASIIQQDGVHGVTLGFLNVVLLKHISRFLACITRGMRFIRLHQPRVLVVHGVHTPFLLFARLIKPLYRTSICVVMTDPPGVVREGDGKVVRMFKFIDRHLVRFLSTGFDGAICLTPALAEDFAPGVPSLIMEGFANPELSRIDFKKDYLTSTRLHIAYAGGINAEYGVANLVRAFQRISDPTARLELYGRGPLDAWVLKQSEVDARIKHHGLVAHEDLIPRLAHASVLVNPRPAAQGFVRYSFPSKLLEYMALGVPVVTTRLDSLPKEYLPFFEVTEDDSVEALVQAIERVHNHYAVAVERALQGQVYVVQEKSVAAQGKRIAEFLAGLPSKIATQDAPSLDAGAAVATETAP